MTRTACLLPLTALTSFAALAELIECGKELQREVGGILHPDLGDVHRCAVEPVNGPMLDTSGARDILSVVSIRASSK